MKRFTTLFLLFCTVSFYACKKDKSNNTDTRKTLLTKMTNSYGSFVYEYDQQNRMISETRYPAATPTVMNLKEVYADFNANGQPTTIMITGDPSVVSGIAEYDGQNRVIKITYRNTAGVTVSSQRFAYTGNSVDLTTINEQTGRSISRTVYTFNAQGNIATYDMYNTTGAVSQRVVNKTFDDKKSVKEFYSPINGVFSVNNETAYEVTVVSSGQVFPFTNSIEYNNDGFVTKYVSKNMNTGAESIFTYEYIKR